ncbi:MAG: CoA transferase [Pseudomonadota bacterium]
MTKASQNKFNQAIETLAQLGPLDVEQQSVKFTAQQLNLSSRFRAAEGAGAALAAGACVANNIAQVRGHQASTVALSSRHAEASLLSFAYLQFADQARAPALRLAPEQRTAAAGFYPTADGRWVYLHSGFPHNTAGLLKLLGTPDDHDAVAKRVGEYEAQALEDAIAGAGLCGAMVRTPEEWDSSLAGHVLNTRPVVDIIQVGDSDPEPFPEDHARPLNGVNVLDLTRILAGPTCARTLASYGASVLRVGAEHLPSIPLFVADTGIGKRSTFLDFAQAHDKATLNELISQADVFSQGYRTGAMERHGFGVKDVVARRPGIVYVSINCYGHEGAWRNRPGWEQLAQTVTGMAHVHGQDVNDGTPELQPAAVTDYTTGYLAAYGALCALQRRAQMGGSYWVRVSLARTGVWIRNLELHKQVNATPFKPTELAKMQNTVDTAWSEATYLKPAVQLSQIPVEWQQPPVPLGTHSPAFGNG